VKAKFADTAEAFYPALLETMLEGCLVVDGDGIITLANRAAREFTPIQGSSLLGQNIVDFFSDDCRTVMSDALASAVAAKAPWSSTFDARLRGHNTGIPVRISIRSLHAEDGRFVSGILVVTDISEQVQARELQKDLMRTTVHDLRNPLNVISQSLAMLRDPDQELDRTEATELLDMMDIGVHKMLMLVNSILDVSRLETGTMTIKQTYTCLEDEIRAAVRGQSTLAAAKQVTLDCEALAKDCKASIDVGLIARVLQNLLDNAIRFSPAGGRIEVRLTDSLPGIAIRPSLCVSVCDYGPGVPPDMADRLFDKFVTRSTSGGYGLGLTFCRLAVEAHGGKIWHVNNPTAGATFFVSLPRHPSP
ncbi:MAG: ATP-binding protein, partial [Myxococcota bacterium]